MLGVSRVRSTILIGVKNLIYLIKLTYHYQNWCYSHFVTIHISYFLQLHTKEKTLNRGSVLIL